MSAQKPFYVSRKRWLSLALGIASASVALFITYGLVGVEVVSRTQGGPPPPAVSIVILGFFALVLYGGAALGAWRFVKSSRIEFYDGFARVFALEKRGRRDVPYSQLEVGPLRIRIVRTAVSFHFDFGTADGAGLWDVDDQMGRGADQTLYAFLREKGVGLVSP